MTELHASIRHIPMPRRLRGLPLTENGFPIMFFVDYVDGKPDLRIMDGKKFMAAIEKKLCWMCGQPLGRNYAFVLGPMCAITRTTSEPPCHLECAQYAVVACPFLSRPRMHRRDAGKPEGMVMAGHGIERNPGVTAIWITRSYRPWNAPHGGVLITVGSPDRVEWYTEGRRASYAEVAESVETGAPALFEQMHIDPDQTGAVSEMHRCIAAFLPLLRDLPGRDERRPEPAFEDALLLARAEEIAWFRLHPDEAEYIRPLLPNERPAGSAAFTHARVRKLDAAGEARQREFGTLSGGEFRP